MDKQKILIITILSIFTIGMIMGAANAATHNIKIGKKYNIKIDEKSYKELTSYETKYKEEIKNETITVNGREYNIITKFKKPYKVRIPSAYYGYIPGKYRIIKKATYKDIKIQNGYRNDYKKIIIMKAKYNDYSSSYINYNNVNKQPKNYKYIGTGTDYKGNIAYVYKLYAKKVPKYKYKTIIDCYKKMKIPIQYKISTDAKTKKGYAHLLIYDKCYGDNTPKTYYNGYIKI